MKKSSHLRHNYESHTPKNQFLNSNKKKNNKIELMAFDTG